MTDQSEPRQELLTSLASLYHSQDFSDLVLFAQQQNSSSSSTNKTRFSAHRAIVCPRSEYIYRAVREGRWRDGIESHLTLPHDEETIRLVLEYLYLLDYDPVVPHETDTPTPTTTTSNTSRHSSHTSSSDTLSIRTTDAGAYGHVYGTSAISAFGGPAAEVPFSIPFRAQSSCSSTSSAVALTMHAIPSGGSGDLPDFTAFSHGHGHIPSRQHSHRSRGGRNTTSTTTNNNNRSNSMLLPPSTTTTTTTSSNSNNNAPTPSPLATPTPHLLLHARIHLAASNLLIPGLQTLSLSKFRIQLTRHWDSAEFAEAIHVVFSSETQASEIKDKRMREAVVEALGWGGGRLLEKPEIEVAVCEINGLAYELLKRRWREE